VHFLALGDFISSKVTDNKAAYVCWYRNTSIPNF